MSYTIGAVARETGCRVQTIRYYEQLGLLSAPRRTEGGQRRYERPHLDRVNFIRHCRELGFPLESIRELLDLADSPAAPCEDADRICERQLLDVRRRIERLTALGRELEDMLRQCGGGRIDSCRVIESLSDHRDCDRHTPTEDRFGGT